MVHLDRPYETKECSAERESCSQLLGALANSKDLIKPIIESNQERSLDSCRSKKRSIRG